MTACAAAANDFDEAAKLNPKWAEPCNLLSGVYADCPEPRYRDPEKAITVIKHAIAIDSGHHPTYLTVLALAYFRSGEFQKAVATQKEVMASANFPPLIKTKRLSRLITTRKQSMRTSR